ncbi:phage holin family protein [Gorillibacterium sp. CAU 1737]|uniref:phage holin family protein n=1 Tax=Gorillibacterium sp. CAU 1737 TaxID=3140362 RepID=UPI003260C90B
MRAWGVVLRFLAAAIVLMITAWLVPGFRIGSFTSALLLALVIAGLGWLTERLFHREVTPFSRGTVGFLLSAAVLYLASLVVPGSRITLLGSLVASLVIGIFDLFVPTPGTGNPRTHKGIH